MSDTSRNATMPRRAMVLAAGRGERMRPLTERIPKPLIEVAGKALIDYALDRLADAGVEVAVVNVHHFADLLERHLAQRRTPRIVISDEREQLLETGGGIVKALGALARFQPEWEPVSRPESAPSLKIGAHSDAKPDSPFAEYALGDAPFFLVNSDSLWIDGVTANLGRLAAAYDAARMDALLLLAPTTNSIGYGGRGDFSMAPDGRLVRRAEREVVPFVYAGAAILAPALFAGAPEGPFSLTCLFDRAAGASRLFGLRLDGLWMHVGTPDAIPAAEAAIKASAA